MKRMYSQKERIILGSASPRRKSLLTEQGIEFDCSASDLDETVIAGETPQALAARLALAKAHAVAKLYPDKFVLGADTDVAIDGQILGKPQDSDDACRLLKMIAGKTHTVWGGCALVNLKSKIEEVIVSSTLVTMAPMSDEDIKRYVLTGEPMDKAGAYAVQGIGSQFIVSISGSHPNVVGLDVPQVITLLRKHGILY